MKGTYIFLADGFEISEALTTVNMLRRGGVNVKTVSTHQLIFGQQTLGCRLGHDRAQTTAPHNYQSVHRAKIVIFFRTQNFVVYPGLFFLGRAVFSWAKICD